MPAPDEFIFGPSRWLRGLIKPGPGFGVAYIDWKTQEVGIAAALSGDENLMADYLSEDLYIAFGVASGVLPKGATKKSHKVLREMLKQCVLGLKYGMGAKTLALKIGQSELMARSLIAAHNRRYRKFWQWSNAMVARGMQGLPLSTVFRWNLNPTEYSRPTTLMNFPMQANGAEILRLACCLGIERGIRICAPIHDAILIEAPLERLEADVAAMREAMAKASRTCSAVSSSKPSALMVAISHKSFDIRNDTWTSAVLKCGTRLRSLSPSGKRRRRSRANEGCRRSALLDRGA